MDAEAKMKVCVVILKPRFFPIAGGTGTAYVTIKRPDIEETVHQLLEGIKWTGPADVDFILDPRDQIPKVLEINPRVSACIKIAFAAGVDFANYTVDLALGLPIKKMVRYKQNVCLRNTVMESLWFISATGTMRRNTYPAFFSLKNVVEETFSWSDPFTMLGYILGLIRKYSSIKKLRKKFHK
jgi:predicted ATP-grasp superfamily ATP-dependent carboligase